MPEESISRPYYANAKGHLIAKILTICIKGTFLVVGTGMQAFSGWLTGEFLAMGAPTTALAMMMRYTGYGLEIIKYFISPIAWAEISTKLSGWGITRAVCGIMLSGISFFCSVFYFNSSTIQMASDAQHAEKSLKDREAKIKNAQDALYKFDLDSETDKAAELDYIDQGKDTKALNASSKRRAERKLLADKVDEALSLPCEKVPDIGELNRIYNWLVKTTHLSIETVRLIFNMAISFAIEFAIFNSLAVSGMGSLITRSFLYSSENYSNNQHKTPENNEENTKNNEEKPTKKEPKKPNFSGSPGPVPGWSPSDPEVVPKWSCEGLYKAYTTSPPPFFGYKEDAKPMNYNKGGSGDHQKTTSRPPEPPKPLTRDDILYQKMIDYVAKSKSEWPDKPCGLNKISKGIGISEDQGISREKAATLLSRGIKEGLFIKIGVCYEPTAEFYAKYIRI